MLPQQNIFTPIMMKTMLEENSTTTPPPPSSEHMPRAASIKVRQSEYKDVLKKRAMDNLVEKRQQLRDVMRDPLHYQSLNFHDEYVQSCKLELERILRQEKGTMTDDEYNNLLWELEQEIEKELKEEEEEFLKEYEEQQRMEAQDMEELINFYEKSVFLCPFCKKNYLHETKHSLFCKCGLRIPTSVRFYFDLLINIL